MGTWQAPPVVSKTPSTAPEAAGSLCPSSQVLSLLSPSHLSAQFDFTGIFTQSGSGIMTTLYAIARMIGEDAFAGLS